jgi:hypothetical protein
MTLTLSKIGESHSYTVGSRPEHITTSWSSNYPEPRLVGDRDYFVSMVDLRHGLLRRHIGAPAAEPGDVARAGGGGGFDQEAFGFAAVG